MSPQSSGSKNKTSKKKLANRTIHLFKSQVYIGNRNELKDNSTVPIGSLTEWSEPIGDKISITQKTMLVSCLAYSLTLFLLDLFFDP
jgi:hypothetical protein